MNILNRLALWGISFLILVGCRGNSSAVDRLERINTNQKLLVAADIKTGFPFIHFNKEIEAYGGFEYEVAEYLAQKLGVQLEIVPTQWEKLLETLRGNQVDIVLNGIEKPQENSQYPSVTYSYPYYTSHQQLMVSAKDNFTYNLSDLDKKKVGAIEFSVASAMLEELNRLKGTKISVQHYQKPETMFQDLSQNKINALLTERAVASWFGWDNKQLRPTGDKISEHTYVIALRATDTSLLNKINTILKQAPQDKVFQAIERKWRLRK